MRQGMVLATLTINAVVQVGTSVARKCPTLASLMGLKHLLPYKSNDIINYDILTTCDSLLYTSSMTRSIEKKTFHSCSFLLSRGIH